LAFGHDFGFSDFARREVFRTPASGLIVAVHLELVEAGTGPVLPDSLMPGQDLAQQLVLDNGGMTDALQACSKGE